MLKFKNAIYAAGACVTLGMTLAACGGGGGSTPAAPSGGGTATATPTSAATPSPSPSPTASPTLAPAGNAISGTLVDRAAGTPISGATVTLGIIPNQASCAATQTNAQNACGTVGATTATTTTSSTGAFSIGSLATGTQMLVIGNGSSYAALHAEVTIANGANALGTLKLTALSADQQAWVSDLNTLRTTVSNPVSFSNLVVDEYAVEAEQAMVDAVVAGTATFGPSAETTYDTQYGQNAGAMYAAGGNSSLGSSAGAFLAVDQSWMAEQSQCANGNWQTCTFTAASGHYINVSNTDSVWIGPAESATSYVPSMGAANAWVYGVMIVQNVNGSALVDGVHRATAPPLHRKS